MLNVTLLPTGIDQESKMKQLLESLFSALEEDFREQIEKASRSRTQSIADHVQASISLPVIDLSGNALTDRELIEVVLPILDATLPNAKWTCLDLRGNALSPLCMRRLVHFLNRVCESLEIRVLRLDNNNIGDSGILDLCKEASPKLLESLRVLTMASNQISSESAVKLGQMVAQSKLSVFSLDDNSLGDEGVRNLVSSLGGACLNTLLLARNRITSKGASAVGEMLPRMMHLRELSLSANSIGNDGAKCLAKGIANGAWRMQKLHVAQCGLTNDGVTSFIPVTTKSNLEYLDFSGNDMEPTTCDQIRNIMVLKDSKWSKSIQALLSARDIPRLGKTAPVSMLPKELIRHLGEFLPKTEPLPTPPSLHAHPAFALFPLVAINLIINVNNDGRNDNNQNNEQPGHQAEPMPQN